MGWMPLTSVFVLIMTAPHGVATGAGCSTCATTAAIFPTGIGVMALISTSTLMGIDQGGDRCKRSRPAGCRGPAKETPASVSVAIQGFFDSAMAVHAAAETMGDQPDPDLAAKILEVPMANVPPHRRPMK